MKLVTQQEVAVNIYIRIVDHLGNDKRVIFKQDCSLCKSVHEILSELDSAMQAVKRTLED